LLSHVVQRRSFTNISLFLLQAQLKLKEKELRLAKEIMKETILKAKVDRKGEVLKKANERIIKLKRKGTKKTTAADSNADDEVDESEDEEADEAEDEKEDHYKIYGKTDLDDDIVKIIRHHGTNLFVDWADKLEHPDPKTSLPLLWADYPHTVSMYRRQKKCVGKHMWWRNPIQDLVEELTNILGHKGDIKKNLKKCIFEVLGDNGCRMEDVAYSNLVADDKRQGTSLLKAYLQKQY
jgi:hypothetical protein